MLKKKKKELTQIPYSLFQKTQGGKNISQPISWSQSYSDTQTRKRHYKRERERENEGGGGGGGGEKTQKLQQNVSLENLQYIERILYRNQVKFIPKIEGICKSFNVIHQINRLMNKAI